MHIAGTPRREVCESEREELRLDGMAESFRTAFL